MAYIDPSFKSKADLKRAFAAKRPMCVFSPSPFPPPTNGKVGIEGPNYQPHSWYATVTLKDGEIISVK